MPDERREIRIKRPALATLLSTISIVYHRRPVERKSFTPVLLWSENLFASFAVKKNPNRKDRKGFARDAK
jgi:hypothetical protein